jgi:lysophospholipase L1-like esterase
MHYQQQKTPCQLHAIMYVAGYVVAVAAHATPTQPQQGVISVSCVGDSITVADGDQCYPNQLGKMLGAGYNVTNRGVSGHTMLTTGLCAASPSGSWRHPCLHVSDAKPCTGNCSYWGTTQFQATLDSSPDIITIMLGTNDAKWCNWFGPPNGKPAGTGTQFASDYVRMIKLFKALPSKPKVYVVLPPPAISQCSQTGPAGNASVCLAYNMSFRAINEIFPVLQRQIAKDGGADGVIDVWSALNGTSCTTQAAGKPLMQQPCPHTMDGIHPYSDAQTVVAQTIAKGIKESAAA